METLIPLILGIIAGAFVAIAIVPDPISWDSPAPYRVLRRATLAGLALLVFSPVLSFTLAFSALLTMAGISARICYNCDEDFRAGFRAWVGRLTARSWLGLRVLIYGRDAVEEGDHTELDDNTVAGLARNKPSVSDAVDGLFKSVFNRRSERARTALPVSPNRPRAHSTAQPARTPAPAAQPAPRNCWNPRSWVTADASVTEAQVIQGVLAQMAKLQQDYLRPESERKTLQELVAATKNTEKSLRQAVEQLKTGTLNLQDLKGHIDCLKQQELPEELSAALDALLCQREAIITAGEASRRELSNQLQNNRDALVALQHKPLVSPEQAIRGADEALSQAASVNPPCQTEI